MQRFPRLILLGPAALAWLACSDGPSAPAPPGGDPAAPVILSDPQESAAAPAVARSGGSSAGEVTFVSLPPGSVPGATTVLIRNVTADGDPLIVPVVNGGFDPVALPAAEGDSLELEFRDQSGAVELRKAGSVPDRRPPVLIRTSPPSGRTDVALGIRPTAVFSEPVDPATLAAAVRLLRDGEPVGVQVATPPTEPWVVQVVPAELLQPATEYRLDIGPGVLDADGDPLATRAVVDFRTVSGPEPPPPLGSRRIAYVSDRFGEPRIYLANTDGLGIFELTVGHSPAWSRDGRRIAFVRGYELYVVNADGSGERLVATGTFNGGPSWSPDDSQFALAGEQGIYTLGIDGAGETVLYRPPDPYFGWGGAQWSPDGQSIAFQVRQGGGYYHQQVMVLELGNPDPVFLTGEDPARWGQRDPVWSPDGLHITFSADSGQAPSGGTEHGYALISARPDRTEGPTFHVRREDVPVPQNFDGYACCLSDPAWSPDGQRLAFISAHVLAWEQIGTVVQVVDVTTGQQRVLINDGRALQVAWSPVP